MSQNYRTDERWSSRTTADRQAGRQEVGKATEGKSRLTRGGNWRQLFCTKLNPTLRWLSEPILGTFQHPSQPAEPARRLKAKNVIARCRSRDPESSTSAPGASFKITVSLLTEKCPPSKSPCRYEEDRAFEPVRDTEAIRTAPPNKFCLFIEIGFLPAEFR